MPPASILSRHGEGVPPNGGGGGGATTHNTVLVGRGGGTLPFGQFGNGAHGNWFGGDNPGSASAGSGGQGSNTTGNNQSRVVTYGGGGGAGWGQTNVVNNIPTDGGNGVVRIVWGNSTVTRAFPTTNVGNI